MCVLIKRSALPHPSQSSVDIKYFELPVQRQIQDVQYQQRLSNNKSYRRTFQLIYSGFKGHAILEPNVLTVLSNNENQQYLTQFNSVSR